jgi:SAM-dependent methyltransferase
VRASVEALAPRARGLLLDVGVAERPHADLLAPFVERYVGLDYPPALINVQPELWNILHRAKQAVDVFGDGNRLPFRDGAFDTVLCVEVLEHMRSPERCVAEMGRVLAPGGRILLTVPFCQPLHQLPSDYYRFAPAALEAMFTAAGLETESIEARGNYASALGALASQFLLRAFGARERLQDGGVIPGRARAVLVLPLVALTQVVFDLASKLLRDDALPMGYRAVARKPG